MRLRLRVSDGGGAPPPLEVVVPSDDNFKVGDLRETVIAKLQSQAARNRIQMMLRGKLLMDDSEVLSRAGARDADEIAVAVWEPFGCGRAEENVVPSRPKISERALVTAFNLSSLPAAELQAEASADVLSMFTDFIKQLLTSGRENVSDQELHKEYASNAVATSLAEFDTYQKGLFPPLNPTAKQMKALEYATLTLENKKPGNDGVPHITWYPQYGCCVVASRIRVTAVMLELIGLDGWDFRVHGHESEYTANSRVGGSVSLFSGCIHPSKYNSLIEHLRGALKKSEKRTKGERSAGQNVHGGNQKTPGFVYARLVDSMNLLNDKQQSGPGKETTSRGGFTDVGMHTDCSPRNTTWPLVCAIVHRSLDAKDCGNCFQFVMTHLQLWVAETFTAQLQPGDAYRHNIDIAMDLLQSPISNAIRLIDTGFHMHVFELRCALIRAAIEDIVEARSTSKALEYRIDTRDTYLGQQTGCRDLQMLVPQRSVVSEPGNSLEQAKVKAARNIGCVPLLDIKIASWKDMITWFQLPTFQNSRASDKVILSLNTVERYVMHHASSLASPSTPDNSLSLEIITEVEMLVELYRKRASTFRESKDAKLLRATELLSLEVLVVWVCFCLVHKSVKKVHPLLSEYGVSLCYNSLSHIVLSDIDAIDAAYSVSCYLDENKKCGKGIFALLSNSDPTFAFAEQVASRSPVITAILANEKRDMDQREEQHWEQVQRQQRKLRNLRQRLNQLQSELDTKETQLTNTTRYEVYGPRQNLRETSAYSRASDACREWRDKVRDVEKEIDATEVPPDNVFHPLPELERLALQVLFFLYIPRELNTLARLCVMAQLILLPRSSTYSIPGHDWDVDSLVASGIPATNWASYYNNTSSGCRAQSGSNCKLPLYSKDKPPNEKQGPGNVSSYTSRRDGVFYPDRLVRNSLVTTWSGAGFDLDQRGCGFYNPFRAGRVYTLIAGNYFTEKLDSKDNNLQWAMPQLGLKATTEDRGNVVIAKQGKKPTWLSKTAFLAFGSVRAYPRQQLRKLCVALHDRSVPLSHDSVRKLLAQALFQLGDLTASSREAFLQWQGDAKHGIWAALTAELLQLAEELRCKPRDHESVSCLAEITSYVAQYWPQCSDAEDALAIAALEWATAIESERTLRGNLTSQNIKFDTDARARQCKFYLFVVQVLASRASEDSENAWERICSAMMLADSRRVLDGKTDHDKAISRAFLSVNKLQARRALRLAGVALSSSSLLTTSVRKVLQDAPLNLIWTSLPYPEGGYSTPCFQAISQDRHLYTVNVLDGRILFDGLPLRRLPKSILSHQLFLRVFGKTNFDVSQTTDGVLKTVRRVGGRNAFYSFSFNSESSSGESDERNSGMVLPKLTIIEFSAGVGDGGEDVKFELLDPACGSWATDLPLRLLKMYSHWLCRASGVILLRPISHEDVGTYFILRNNVGSQTWKCYRVSRHLSKKPWRQLALHEEEKFDRLVKSSSSVAKVLSKFETDSFIDLYITPSGAVSYELPRYEIAFFEDQVCLGETSHTTDSSLDSAIASQTFAGFDLCRSQQLSRESSASLESFTQYLVLRKRGTCQLKVVVPNGKVSCNQSGSEVHIAGNTSYSASRKWHSYDVHPRFGTLISAGLPGRLQLAAIYSAVSSSLPMANKLTGHETAMQLVRACWSNVPMSQSCMEHLRQIVLHGQRCPALVLLCANIAESSGSLQELYPSSIASLSIDQKFTTNAAAAYSNEKKKSTFQKRAELKPQEEVRSFGRLIKRNMPRPFRTLQDVSEIPKLQSDYLKKVYETQETLLQDLLSSKEAHADPSLSTLDISARSGDTKLGKEFLADLQASLDRYLSLGCLHLSGSFEGAHGLIQGIRSSVESGRSTLQRLLLEMIFLADHDPGLRMARSAAIVSFPSIHDVCRCSFEPQEVLMALNPTLSEELVLIIQQNSLLWLQLCVLEDKVDRLLSYSKGMVTEFVRDLSTVRVWKPEENPRWLVFEVEQQLQIRPIQHLIVHHLLNDCRGNLTQLNVGLGKTRVIVPMLIMSCVKGAAEKQKHNLGACRVYFLPQLLHEGYEYLHKCLTGSILNLRLYRAPFNRDVPVGTNSDLAAKLRETLSNCQKDGALVLAPQDRLSFILKTIEQEVRNVNSPVLATLKEIVQDQKWMDVMDESDEILRHTNQLVYAMGDCVSLPQGNVRGQCAHLVLEALGTNEVSFVLSNPDIARRTPCTAPGGMDEVYLIDGQKLKGQWRSISRLIAASVIAKNTQGMKWMLDPKWKQKVMDVVCNPELGFEAWEADLGAIPDNHRQQLLGLRAMLACGLLESCLYKRHRVAYGIDRRRGASRRVAVPFRFSDTPSERSEFAHPDAQILYTSLSYLYDGLSRIELHEALSCLSKMGPQARKHEYDSWLALSKERVPEDQFVLIDNEVKLDPSSKSQFEVLNYAFRSNLRTVTFFLRGCVFPLETMTFPLQMRATGWWLSDNSQTIGFSGTDDSKRLLPVHVKQTQPDVDELLATNGQMAMSICKSAVDFDWDSKANGAEESVWSALINHAVQLDASALIDCGALLTGVGMKNIAEYTTNLLEEADSKFKGVVYCSGKEGWIMLSRDEQIWPLSRSPIHESDAFVIFDESHCRGADMKLKRDAMAVVSVGVNACKDQLIQAVGRMRKLGPGRQSVRIAVPSEVGVQLQSAGFDRSASGILNWCVSNSIAAVADGLSQWASQGMHYYTVKSNSSQACEDEHLDLDYMYKAAIGTEPVAIAVTTEREHWGARVESLHQTSALGIEKVIEKVEELGEGFSVVASQGMGEECERELENEREVQKEIEREVSESNPRREIDWDFSKVLNAASIADIQALCGPKHIGEYVKNFLWPTSFPEASFNLIYASENFLTAVESNSMPSNQSNMSDFLRPVDACVVFASDEVLLLSEREADCVLSHFWMSERVNRSPRGPHPQFFNLCFMSEVAVGKEVTLCISRNRGQVGSNTCNEDSMAALQLFNGDTIFRNSAGLKLEERIHAVRRIMKSNANPDEVLHFSLARGKGIYIDGSDLQELIADEGDS